MEREEWYGKDRQMMPVLLADTRVLIIILNAGLKHTLIHTTQGTAPVIRNVLKGSARHDAMFRISFFRIIGIATRITKILLHDKLLLSKHLF